MEGSGGIENANDQYVLWDFDKMNWMDVGQHNQPHFLAFYGDYEASFALDGEILAREFPKRQAVFVKAWALLHEDDLRANWRLAVNGEETFRIDALK